MYRLYGMKRSMLEQKKPEDLLNYCQQIETARNQYMGLMIHLSKLNPVHRQRQHLDNAIVEFRRLTAHFDHDRDAQIFYNPDGDIAYVSKNRDALFYEKLILRFKPMFQDDPLVHGSYKAVDQFYTLFDLGQQYDGFVDLAEERFGKTKSNKQNKASHMDVQSYIDTTEVKLEVAVELERVLKQTNVSNFLRRQQIYSVYQEQFVPLKSEYYLSLAAIESVMMPGSHILANPWLSRYIMQLLDKRTINTLLDMFKEKRNLSYHVNLSLRTVFTPTFHDYIQRAQSLGQNITIEIDHIDFLADFEAFLFARDFLQSKNVQICVDNVKKQTFPLFCERNDTFDYMKLAWNLDLLEDSDELAEIRDGIYQIGPEKLIMSKSDDKQAFDTGLNLGITNFQGFWFDQEAQNLKSH